MQDDIAKVLFTEREIEKRVASLAAEIAGVYPAPHDDITIVTILAGAVVFLSDLIRRLPLRMRIGLIAVSSYKGPITASRGARVESDILPDLRDRNVLIVDDILETGGTLRLVQAEVRRTEPRDVRTAVLLRKPSKAPADLPVDFVGFDVGDEFVVGYGLDYDGLYRNLPCIAVLKPELYDAERFS